jgi:hypothetical protein
MKRSAPVSAGSHLACVVGRPTLVGVCNLAVDGATGRGEPTVMSSMASGELIHLGMDTSVNTIVVGVLRPGEEMPVVERVFNDEESIRRLIGGLLIGDSCRRVMRLGQVAMSCSDC